MNTKIDRHVRPTYRKPLFATVVSGILFGALLHGCNGSQVGGDNLDAAGPGGGGTQDMAGGGGTGGDMSGQSGYCAGSGPPIVVGDGSGSVSRCTGQVAAAAFRYGLCSCQGLSSGAPIAIDAFDSTQPGATTFGNGGSAGMNSNVNVSNKFSVGGVLQVSGALTLNELTVGSDLLLGDTLSGNGNVTVAKNAQIGGDVKCNGLLKIGGTLTYPTTRTLSATSQAIGQIARAAVTVAPPCDCSPSSIFDIAGYVTARATSNDNASVPLDPARLTNFAGDQTIDLPCGRFYLNRIGGQGKVTLNITGRTALFVGGDVNLTDTFTVNLGPSGELDLFINGGLTSSAPLNFGNKSAPARVRLYMGGARNINLAAGSVLGGNVYAPNSALVTSGPLEVFGALFVGSFNPSAQVQIHHDIAIIKASQECTPSGSGGGGGSTMCTKCQDCGGQACKSGSCGSCTQNSDCCSPLVCDLRNNTCAVLAG
ncbi:MAG TPA: hypothetical protein PKO07_25300 [Pseudomonadota bacterium]|nr:hypothetical protein [Pseudomonadota bacterium]HNN54372.1 hypothetical protein [Pseudomonadota bacterium]